MDPLININYVLVLVFLVKLHVANIGQIHIHLASTGMIIAAAYK